MDKMTEQMAIEFLKMYLDEELYLKKCVEAHSMAIQALEEIQQIKETIKDFALDCGNVVLDVKEMYRQLNEYLKIGTVEEFKALKEKAEPKKPRWHGHNFCPCCDGIVYVNGGRGNYCPTCGQKLDWE